MSRSKASGSKKHLCYYGYTKVSWYRISCPICHRIVTNNIPKLFVCSAILLSGMVLALMILLKT